MPKEAVFTMTLEPELREAFMAEAEAAHRPASQMIRELMRDFVQRQRDARGYNGFLRRKVALAQARKDAGLHASTAEVEAEAAARRCCARSIGQRREGSLDRGGVAGSRRHHRLYPGRQPACGGADGPDVQRCRDALGRAPAAGSAGQTASDPRPTWPRSLAATPHKPSDCHNGILSDFLRYNLRQKCKRTKLGRRSATLARSTVTGPS